MYYTYVLYSPDYQEIYIGSTSDLENLVETFNGPETKGWTVKYRPWVLYYKEEFQKEEDALVREKQLKSGKGKEFIWNMLNGSNRI